MAETDTSPAEKIPSQFEPLVQQLQQCDQKLQQIEQLLTLMTDNEILFQPDERQAVSDLLSAQRLKQDQLGESLKTKIELWQKHVVTGRQVLHERKRLLAKFDNDTNLLANTEELMQLFVNSQTAMENQISTVESELLSFTPPSDDDR